jgi:hypothetical protein
MQKPGNSSEENPLKHLTAEEREAVLYSLSTVLREVRGDINFIKAYRNSKTMDSDRVVHAINWYLDSFLAMTKEVFLELGQQGGQDGKPLKVEAIPVGEGDAKLYTLS